MEGLPMPFGAEMNLLEKSESQLPHMEPWDLVSALSFDLIFPCYASTSTSDTGVFILYHWILTYITYFIYQELTFKTLP